jgi:hypothetical protein
VVFDLSNLLLWHWCKKEPLRKEYLLQKDTLVGEVFGSTHLFFWHQENWG